MRSEKGALGIPDLFVRPSAFRVRGPRLTFPNGSEWGIFLPVGSSVQESRMLSMEIPSAETHMESR